MERSGGVELIAKSSFHVFVTGMYGSYLDLAFVFRGIVASWFVFSQTTDESQTDDG